MSTITISSLPSGSVLDTVQFASETSGGITQKVTALAVKNYMTTLPTLTVTGGISGVLNFNSSSQPNIATVGVLTSVTTSGQIVSQIGPGVAPMVIASTDFVDNLYVARAAVADSTSGGLTENTFIGNIGISDVILAGNINTLVANLRVVNSTPGTWGGHIGGTYYIPTITINSKGQVTFAANSSINLDLPTQTVTYLQGTTNQINVDNHVGQVTLSLPSTVDFNTLNATSVVVSGSIDATAGSIASGPITDSGSRVVSAVIHTAGTGISISNETQTGPAAAVQINNTGVLELSAGSGMSVNRSTGVVTITNSGVVAVVGANGITANAATGSVTLSPTSGYNGYGARTISTGTPSGGNDGDIWYQV